jgi:hypothetical protein
MEKYAQLFETYSVAISTELRKYTAICYWNKWNGFSFLKRKRVEHVLVLLRNLHFPQVCEQNFGKLITVGRITHTHTHIYKEVWMNVIKL